MRRPGRPPRQAGAAVAVAYGLMAAFLWRLDGLQKVGLIEEWSLYESMASGRSLVPTSGTAHVLRPLSKIPQTLAWVLTPDSFVGLHLVHASLFVVKGWLAYALVRSLSPGRHGVAVLTGALVLAWPADAGLFATRAISPHFALVAFLAAAILLVRFVRTGSRWAGLAMALALAIALLVHEIVLPLALAAPLILVRRRLPPATWARLAAWYPLPLVAAARLGYELTLGSGSYQRAKLEIAPAAELLHSLAEAYGHVLLSPWPAALDGLGGASLGAALGVALPAAFLAAVVDPRRDAGPPQIGSARLAVAALTTVALGFLPYLPTAMRATAYTTLFASSLGAALLTALVCGLLARRTPRPRAALAVVTAGAVALLLCGARAQHESYVRWSSLQQRLLLDIVEQGGGGFAPRTVVLLIGKASGEPPPGWLFDPRYPFFPPIAFRDGLVHALGDDDVLPRLCYPRHAPSEADRWWSHSCELGPRSVRVLTAALPPLVLPYERVVVFAYDPETRSATLLSELPPGLLARPDLGVDGYAPRRRRRPDPAAELRAMRLLPDPAARLRDRSLPAAVDVLVDFDVEPRGTGWEATGPPGDGTGWSALPAAPDPGRPLPPGWTGHPAQSWTVARRATLTLPLRPGGGLTVEARVTHALSPAVLDDLALEVDGRRVPLSREPHPAGGEVFRAHVPGELRGEGRETLVTLVVDELLRPSELGLGKDRRELGVRIDWLHAFVTE